MAAISLSIRQSVLRRDGFACCMCGRTAADGIKLEVDHKKPASKGGNDDIGNLWVLCDACNQGKKNKWDDAGNGAGRVAIGQGVAVVVRAEAFRPSSTRCYIGTVASSSGEFLRIHPIDMWLKALIGSIVYRLDDELVFPWGDIEFIQSGDAYQLDFVHAACTLQARADGDEPPPRPAREPGYDPEENRRRHEMSNQT